MSKLLAREDSVTRFSELYTAYEQKVLNGDKNPDVGIIGKLFEVVIREYIQPYSVRNNGKISSPFKYYGDMLYKNDNGTYSKTEIKYSCGELARINNDIQFLTEITDETLSDYVLPNANTVIYAPEIDLTIPLEQQAYVFTRDEFISMLSNYNGSGRLLRIKQSSDGNNVISFQSFYSITRPKSSKKIYQYLIDTCICQSTVEEFFNK